MLTAPLYPFIYMSEFYFSYELYISIELEAFSLRKACEFNDQLSYTSLMVQLLPMFVVF